MIGSRPCAQSLSQVASRLYTDTTLVSPTSLTLYTLRWQLQSIIVLPGLEVVVEEVCVEPRLYETTDPYCEESFLISAMKVCLASLPAIGTSSSPIHCL